MDINEELEIKREFQLERIILFSDAVFAIIITIMVLDIRLPEGLRHAGADEVKQAFTRLLPKMLAYCLSFFLVAKFWLGHLKMFSLLKDYDPGLLAYNLLYLFSVSLFPFAVSLISGNISLESMQFACGIYTYAGIFLFSIFSQTLLARYLINNRHKLCFDTNNLDKILKYKTMRLNLILVPIVGVALFGLNYLGLRPFYAVYALVAYGVVKARISKNYYPEKDVGGPILSRLFRLRKKIFTNRQRKNELVNKE
jgi:uncharacterized membrane protein